MITYLENAVKLISADPSTVTLAIRQTMQVLTVPISFLEGGREEIEAELEKLSDEKREYAVWLAKNG